MLELFLLCECFRSIVELFFPHDMLPYVDPFTAKYKHTHDVAPPDDTTTTYNTVDNVPNFKNGACILEHILPKLQVEKTKRHHQQRLKKKLNSWTRDPIKFWRQVFWFVHYRSISVEGFVEFANKVSSNRLCSRKASPNINKVLINGLFKKRGTMRDFCDHLSIAMKTGNMEILINTIRERLGVAGVHCNIVPSVRNIKISTATLTKNYIAICKPERSHSGFRLDLVACVKLVAFFILKKTDLDGVRIDIWGDGVEIGGVDVTRMTFRLLCDAISAQSSTVVFCFAAFRGELLLNIRAPIPELSFDQC